MKKYILILSLLLLPLHAQSITAGYDVSFGFVGEIGKANAEREQRIRCERDEVVEREAARDVTFA